MLNRLSCDCGRGVPAGVARLPADAGSALRTVPPGSGRRARRPTLGLAAASLLALSGAVASSSAFAADPPVNRRAPRPPDLVTLLRSQSVNGDRQVGVFGAKADPQRPGLWSVQVWEETQDRITIATDRIGCSPTAPTRITGSGSQLLVRELNPGGVIHPANRLDHLIWWAVCHPSQAGRDPAALGSEARRLGYSGQLQETQQVLQAPRN